jgi:hypothetical protein
MYLPLILERFPQQEAKKPKSQKKIATKKLAQTLDMDSSSEEDSEEGDNTGDETPRVAVAQVESSDSDPNLDSDLSDDGSITEFNPSKKVIQSLVSDLEISDLENTSTLSLINP